MAAWYLSEESASGHLLPPGLRTLHLSGRRIERSGLNLLFLSLALVENIRPPQAV